LKSPQTHDWSFTVEFDADDQITSATRSVASPAVVHVTGDVSRLPIAAVIDDGEFAYPTRDWTRLLGHSWYLLPIDAGEKYRPSFRAIVSFALRRGRDAFASPFDTHRKTQEWTRQVLNAFLLGLDWELASEWQRLRDRRQVLRQIRRAAREGLVHGLTGTRGELEADRVRLESEVARQRADLERFQVHPQYRQIEQEASTLTAQLHELANESVVETELLDTYERSAQVEEIPTARRIASLYEAAGATLPESIRHTLLEVEQFHSQVVQNRRLFLTAEVEGLRRRIAGRSVRVREFSERRASLMEILSTHGALDEYLGLQQLHAENVARLNDVVRRGELLKEFEEGDSAARLEEELLRQRALTSYDELTQDRERAVSLFNEYSEELYDSPGNLLIEVTQTGYKFDIDIQRSGSGGVGHMKVFLYDLVQATLLRERRIGPGFLVHDSIVFEGVDERQIAAALQLAERVSRESGFQYICLMNSDQLPRSDLPATFDVRAYVRMTLNDTPPDASLLGTRF